MDGTIVTGTQAPANNKGSATQLDNFYLSHP